VLILDEPTVGLDPAQIREVRALIRELAGSHTILLSTHILPEVELTCDRVVLIARGRIRGQGTIKELQQSAAGATQYVVETDAPRAEAALTALPMVQRVDARRLDSRWYRITITPRADDIDLREQISRSLADGQSVTRELHRLTPSLEHLFVKMVADAETADAPAAARNGSALRPAPEGADAGAPGQEGTTP
jgi:ABC-2 type transport system ATP-binding protein